MLCRNEKTKGKKLVNYRIETSRQVGDLGIATYKLDLNNKIYSYYDYILNLVGANILADVIAIAFFLEILEDLD
jgi:hypothetical protein